MSSPTTVCTRVLYTTAISIGFLIIVFLILPVLAINAMTISPDSLLPLGTRAPSSRANVVPLAITPTFKAELLNSSGVTAIADLNGDGTFDIVAGSTIVWGDGHGRFTQASTLSGTGAVVLGDLNGDGAIDIYQENSIYWNNGQGEFVQESVFSGTHLFQTIALGDLDGNGTLDIVSGVNWPDQSGTEMRIYWNDGGRFTRTTSLPGYNFMSAAVGDLDEDGNLDIVTGMYNYGQVFWNDGQGNFSETTSLWSSRIQDTALGDIDDDGLLDIVFVKTYDFAVYLNRGDRTFNQYYLSDRFLGNAALGDLNGDGALDLIHGRSYGADILPNIIYWNPGNGIFTTTKSTPFPGGLDGLNYVVGDLNSDGTLDIIQGYASSPDMIYWNNGSGEFVEAASAPFDPASQVAVVDLNDDGELDLVSNNAIYWNDGLGNFTQTLSTSLGSISAVSVSFGDLNGDRTVDIASDGTVFWNDGRGVFTRALPTAYTGTGSLNTLIGDLNADGSLDIVSDNTILRNNGLGEFNQAAPTILGDASVTALALGDLNGDGATDLIQGYDGKPSAIYWNDGQGGFTHSLPARLGGSYATRSIAVGDLNADGAVDIVQGNYAQPCMVYWNDRQGRFSQVTNLGDADYTNIIALVDLNGDGYLDIIQGNGGTNILQSSRVYWNDGLGGFKSDSFGQPSRTMDLAVGDLNGDGALDIVEANCPNQSACYSKLYFNARFQASGLPNNPPLVAVVGPDPLINANFVYTNPLARTPIIPMTYTLSDLEGDPVRFMRAFYSPDGGGKWYPSVATSRTVTTNLETTTMIPALVGRVNTATAANTTPLVIPDLTTITSSLIMPQPGLIADLDVMVNLTHTYDSDLIITLIAPSGQAVHLFNRQGGYDDDLTNTVFDDEAPTSILSGTAPFTGRFRPEQPLSAFDGLAARGNWRLIIADVAGGDLGNLLSWNITATLNVGRIYTYTWDTFASGFFGQSDNVVFRIEAYPSLSSGPNGVPVFQHPYASATTFPFRVRGTQVRVVTPTITHTLPVSQAIVYRLPKGQSTGAEAMSDSTGSPFHTDLQGYLQGRGRIDIGDTLVALLPISTQWRDGSLTFDGVNDYVEIPDVINLNPNRFTIEAWINAAAWTPESWRGTIVGKDDENSGQHGYVLRAGQNGRLSLALSCNGAWASAVSAPQMITGTWYHVAGTYDGATLGVFINGVAAGSAPCAGSVLSSTYPLRIGNGPYDNTRLFAGTIDEVRIWNVARTQAQIQADMERTLKGNESGLVGYWRFDEGAGSIAHDQTAIHNNGTISGAEWLGGGEQYTLFHTSAAPNTSGLSMTPVVKPGVQVLTVTASNPLILFNLDVSLEWDARQETQFLSQLKYDLHRTSELLYDWSNGQAALGRITIYFDRDHWDEADVQIYATNRLRPNAAQGGIVSAPAVDPITRTGIITYAPGQINMGAVWNRYGEASGSLGEDWPRALAHEIGHYALFLDDDYLGLDSGLLIPVDTCAGTAMSDPYRDDYSEFHPGGASWSSDCAKTLAAQSTDRWDWSTITTFYPWLNGTRTNAGPVNLPLNVTQIVEMTPTTSSTVIAAPIFNLTFNHARVLPDESARAFLFQSDHLIDLGRPTLDQVFAHGARLSDRLCVYDQAAQRLGCEIIRAGDEELELVSRSSWRPEIALTPVTSRTFAITVTVSGVDPAGTLRARLYPNDGPASSAYTLTRAAAAAASTEPTPVLPADLAATYRVFLPIVTGGSSNLPIAYQYYGVITLNDPAPQGHVQIWVNNDTEPRREIVTEYALGGDPAHRHGRSAHRHGRSAHRHGRSAPAISPDGDVIVYTSNDNFAPGEFFALQGVTMVPSQPAGRTLVGKAYRLSKSAGAPSFVGASISFFYSGRDVPPGEEDLLRLYFWNGVTWRKLFTRLDTYYNVAVAAIPAENPTQGVGIYALMSSIEIPLYGPGWNQFGYPAQRSKPVNQALLSISGFYTTVYGTVVTDTLDPWKVYDITVPDWVNDLTQLEFGRTYWINVSKSITLEVSGGSAAALEANALPSPPATFYGPVQAGVGFTPTAGATVYARINGNACGQGKTLTVGNQVMYSVNVLPDGPGGRPGCGSPGRSISFVVGSTPMISVAAWDIDRVWYLPLAK